MIEIGDRVELVKNIAGGMHSSVRKGNRGTVVFIDIEDIYVMLDDYPANDETVNIICKHSANDSGSWILYPDEYKKVSD